MWDVVRNEKNVVAGLIFIVIGAIAVFLASDLEIGKASSMGPGYFPMLVGFILIGLGASSAIIAVRSPERGGIEWSGLGPCIAVLASTIAFAVLVERVGLVITIFVCLLICSWNLARNHPIQFALLYIGMTAFCVGSFIYGFGMTIPVFWWQ